MRLTRDGITHRVEKPSSSVKPDDELAFSIGERLKLVKVIQCGARRGPATEAQTLYEDNSPTPPKKQETPLPDFAREKGAGRPTKKDRRDLQRLKQPD